MTLAIETRTPAIRTHRDIANGADPRCHTVPEQPIAVMEKKLTEAQKTYPAIRHASDARAPSRPTVRVRTVGLNRAHDCRVGIGCQALLSRPVYIVRVMSTSEL
jgi:hypothetical protein